VLSVRVRAVMLNLLEARWDLMRAAPRLPVAWRDVRDSFLGGGVVRWGGMRIAG